MAIVLSSRSSSMRLFAAIEPDAALRDALVGVQQALRRGLEGGVRPEATNTAGHRADPRTGSAAPRSRPVRYVAAGDLHLTLRYYGETPADRVDALVRTLADTAARAERCDAGLARIEYWPPRAPRVIVAAFDTPPELERLAAALEAQARTLGYRAENRRYRAHVTLARAPGRPMPGAAVTLPPAMLHVAAIALMHSETAPDGAHYATLRRFALPSPP